MNPLTCDDVGLRLSNLLSEELEDAEEVEAHLARCTECRRQAATWFRQDRALAELAVHTRLGQPLLDGIRVRLEETQPAAAELASTTAGGAPVLPMPQGQRSWHAHAWWLTGLVASVVIGVGVLSWLLVPGSASAMARLEQVQGEVYVVADGIRSSARQDQVLIAGQGLHSEGEDSSAVVVYADGTRVNIGADTLITELSGGPRMRKKVALSEGFLTADVAKQPPEFPMLLATPHAEILVLGTKLNMAHATAATYVEIEQGMVRLTRTSDGRTTDVAAGYQAVATSGPEPLQPQPAPPRVVNPRLIRDGWCSMLSPDGTILVATQYGSGTVELWDVATGQPRQRLQGHGSRVDAAAFSPDGLTLATGSTDRTVKLWDVTTGQLQTTLSGHPAPIRDLVFSRDGRNLTTVAFGHMLESKKTVTIWDLKTGERRPPHEYAARSWALSPDGLTLATASDGQTPEITLWDLLTGQNRQLKGVRGTVFVMKFSLDGQQLAIHNYYCVGGLISVFDLGTGQLRTSLRGFAKGRIVGMAFSADGTRLVTGHRQDTTIRLWDVASGKQLATFEGEHAGYVRTLAFGADGRALVSSENHVPDRGGPLFVVRLWDLPAVLHPNRKQP